MEFIQDLLSQIPSIEEVIRWGGVLILIAIVFAETGLLVGFFLPGDSLLVTAGLFAASGELNVWVLLTTLTVAAYAALLAVAHKQQAAVMAPTEILAEQHHQSFSRLLESSRVRISNFTGSQR